MAVRGSEMCFACGKDNPIGLKLKFNRQDEKVMARFAVQELHQGYDGIMHGGLISTLLDEAMAWYLKLNNISGVTAKLEIRFREPVPVGQTVTVTATEEASKGRMHKLTAVLTLENGVIAAQGFSSFMEFEEDHK